MSITMILPLASFRLRPGLLAMPGAALFLVRGLPFEVPAQPT
jgi:hypothetical protein